MKFELFCLKDLKIKGEGNLHIIILNERTGHVFRFQKENSERNKLSNMDTISKLELNIDKIYKVAVNFKKYNVIQKFWGKVFLPKTEYEERAGLMPSRMIEEIATYVEDQRTDCRKHRSIIIKTAHIEIQPDLTRFPLEYNNYVIGTTFCVELKPKFGILFEVRGTSGKGTCLNRCARYCLSQKRREESNRTEYCPCDFFSGDSGRMKRAIKELIISSQDKLRIFQDGEIVPSIDDSIINKLMSQLLQSTECNNNDMNLVDRFCDLVIQAVTYDKSGSHNVVSLPFQVVTSCQAHPWSEMSRDARTDIFSGSVLGRLIHTACLVDNTSEEIMYAHYQLKQFLDDHKIEMMDNIFDLWNEHLISLDLPEHIRDIVHMLKRYVVCLTIRDCSLMIKFCQTTPERVQTLNVLEDNSMILHQPDGSTILATIEIIDISIKPLSKIKYNFLLEQELKNMFNF